jgi:glycosyltransferase involved in cell wall biosynthesis
VGIPLAWLLKFFGGHTQTRTRHLMITHIMSVKKKMLFLDLFGVQSHIDLFFVYSTWQKRFIESRWNIPSERVVFTPFMVDTCFFAPHKVTADPAARMICSVGLEARDYPTLLKAVRDLDTQVTIAAASPWSKRADSTQSQAIPDNVNVRRFSQFELRQLYADSRFVVMPLFNVDFQAGVTAILEAMAMGRAVICSETPGQTDVVVDGETGIYVPPGDPQALRAAIEYLLNNPQEAERMGQAGRRRVEQTMSLDCYVGG